MRSEDQVRGTRRIIRQQNKVDQELKGLMVLDSMEDKIVDRAE
jgi:hypothetical protein